MFNRRNEQNANRFSCGVFCVRRKEYSCRLGDFVMSAAKRQVIQSRKLHGKRTKSKSFKKLNCQ